MSMAVNNNINISYAANNIGVAAAENQQNANIQNENQSANDPKDAVSLSGQTHEDAKNTKKTYGKPANPEAVARMKKEIEERYNQLRRLVEDLVIKQGRKFSFTDVVRGKAKLQADGEAIRRAQADIAEDGYWGIVKTAERITEFAKALIGDDLSKLPMLRDAVKKGFEAAKAALGGEVPEICQKTYDKVMKEFDSWAEAGSIPTMKEE